jgi:hypothetical protein
MHLVIPGLLDLPRTDHGAVALYQVNPGAELVVNPFVPLPAELETWGRDVVGGDAPDRVRILAVNETDTDLRWPLTIALSEVVDPATGTATELRMHLLFRFLEYGCIACLKASSEPAFQEAFEFLKPLIAAARPDFQDDVPPALALVWSGM